MRAQRRRANQDLQGLGLVPTKDRWGRDFYPKAPRDPLEHLKPRVDYLWKPSDGHWASWLLATDNNAHLPKWRSLDDEEWSRAVGQWVLAHRKLRDSSLQILADKIGFDVNLAASPSGLFWFDEDVDQIVRRRLEMLNELPGRIHAETLQGLHAACQSFPEPIPARKPTRPREVEVSRFVDRMMRTNRFVGWSHLQAEYVVRLTAARRESVTKRLYEKREGARMSPAVATDQQVAQTVHVLEACRDVLADCIEIVRSRFPDDEQVQSAIERLIKGTKG